MNDAPATVDGSLFEGIARTLKPEGAFADELRAVGFDLRAPRFHYPSSVLKATLDVCARHVYPDLPREQAHRQIGQRMVEQFFGTIFGKVLRTLLQALGIERFLMRLPKLAPLGSTGLEIQVERLGPGEVRLVFRGQDLTPEFIAGAMESAARKDKGKDTVVVNIVPGTSTQFELRVTGLR